jgi:glucose/arabinose dehydrogenase
MGRLVKRIIINTMRGFWILVTVFAAACGSSRPSTPSTGSDNGPVSITGRERIGWDQPADDATLLGSLRFVIYVDNARNELAGVSCGVAGGPAGFACSGQLPAMSGGAHTLEIAAFTEKGTDIAEGSRSSPFHVIVAAAAAATAPAITEWRTGETAPTRDGVRLNIEKLAENLDRPIDAAFAPDDRLFIVENDRVRVFADGAINVAPALSLPGDDPSQQLLSIAFDPDFEHTRFVFLLQTIASADGPVVDLARYRELRGALGQRAVLFRSPLDTERDASALLRFGPDGKLYVVVGSGASTGKVFRLNADGTMPRDQPGTNAAVAGGVAIARGLVWDSRVPVLWIVDDDDVAGHLSGISMSAPPVRAIARARTDLPQRTGSMILYTADAIPGMRNNALIASAAGYILRLRFAADDATRVAETEKLLENDVGPIRVIVAGSDGAVYFCTGDALGRLSAVR